MVGGNREETKQAWRIKKEAQPKHRKVKHTHSQTVTISFHAQNNYFNKVYLKL